MASFQGVGRIGQIGRVVSDLARSTRFYREELGARFLFEVPERMAFFDCDGVRLMIGIPESGSGSGSGAGAGAASGGESILYFMVADIDEAHRELNSRGVAFIDEPHKIADLEDHSLWMVFFRDPDGGLLALMEERKSGIRD
ncbi:MAG: VOC family protein [Longimicrobiales bacterium]